MRPSKHNLTQWNRRNRYYPTTGRAYLLRVSMLSSCWIVLTEFVIRPYLSKGLFSKCLMWSMERQNRKMKEKEKGKVKKKEEPETAARSCVWKLWDDFDSAFSHTLNFRLDWFNQWSFWLTTIVRNVPPKTDYVLQWLCLIELSWFECKLNRYLELRE